MKSLPIQVLSLIGVGGLIVAVVVAMPITLFTAVAEVFHDPPERVGNSIPAPYSSTPDPTALLADWRVAEWDAGNAPRFAPDPSFTAPQWHLQP